MSADREVSMKQVATAIIEAEVAAVMEAAEEARAIVDRVAQEASEHSILEGEPPQTGVKQFWAQLLREITAADPNTPST